jgi:hypothetical protein
MSVNRTHVFTVTAKTYRTDMFVNATSVSLESIVKQISMNVIQVRVSMANVSIKSMDILAIANLAGQVSTVMSISMNVSHRLVYTVIVITAPTITRVSVFMVTLESTAKQKLMNASRAPASTVYVMTELTVTSVFVILDGLELCAP